MRITIPMYEKGRSFLLAGGLVKAYEGHQFVYFHLLCQGFENIGKAILLAHDYDKYGPMLTNYLHHHLDRILAEINVVRGGSFLSDAGSEELNGLNKFYRKQKLRYGDEADFGHVTGLQAEHLHRELADHLADLNKQFDQYATDISKDGVFVRG